MIPTPRLEPPVKPQPGALNMLGETSEVWSTTDVDADRAWAWFSTSTVDIAVHNRVAFADPNARVVAERITACIAYCEGISTEDLQRQVTRAARYTDEGKD